MSTSRRRFRPAGLLAGGLGIVAMASCAASAWSSSDVPSAVWSARGAPAVVSGGTWGTAEEVPGSAALNKGGDAEILSVSCASAGNCSAGGFYRRFRPRRRSSSARRTAPGAAPRRSPAPRPSTRAGTPRSTRCRAPRRATAAPAGTTSGRFHHRPGVRRQRDERHLGHRRGGPRHRGPQHRAATPRSTSVSCASAGNCSAGGYYTDSSGHGRRSWSARRNGTWGTAEEVPGTAALNTGRGRRGHLGVVRLGGQLQRRRVLHRRLRQRAGVRGQRDATAPGAPREEVPGTAALNTGGYARDRLGVVRLGGQLQRRRGLRPTAAGVTGRRSWSARPTAPGAPREEVPGTAALNTGGDAADQLGVVRLGGQLQRRRVLHRQLRPPAGVRRQRDERHLGHRRGGARHRGPQHGRVRPGQLGVVRLGGQLQRRRVLHRTAPATRRRSSSARPTAPGAPREEVPGIAALNKGGGAEIISVSCASAGNCSAGGQYGQTAPVTSGVRRERDLAGPGLREARHAGDTLPANASPWSFSSSSRTPDPGKCARRYSKSPTMRPACVGCLSEVNTRLRQNSQFCASSPVITGDCCSVHIGGSARVVPELLDY